MRGDWAKSYHRTGEAARKNQRSSGFESLLLKQAEWRFGGGSFLVSQIGVSDSPRKEAGQKIDEADEGSHQPETGIHKAPNEYQNAERNSGPYAGPRRPASLQSQICDKGCPTKTQHGERAKNCGYVADTKQQLVRSWGRRHKPVEGTAGHEEAHGYGELHTQRRFFHRCLNRIVTQSSIWRKHDG